MKVLEYESNQICDRKYEIFNGNEIFLLPFKVGLIDTVFPHIVSVETTLFWLWPYVLWPLETVHKSAETIQGRKLFKGGNYMRKYGI